MKQFLCLGVCFGFRLVSWGRGGGGGELSATMPSIMETRRQRQ